VSGEGWSRADAAEYERLDLRAHALLADVPLHDVWQVELPGGPPDASIDAVRRYLRFDAIARLNPVVRALFALRGALGRLFRWDSPEPRPSGADPAERDGPFRIVHRSRFEVVGEIRNRTVHAFSVMALARHGAGHRFYWAIHVRPVGRITGAYMAAIDPFRRLFVYPAVLRHVHRSWKAEHAE
jgi:hypothetical protein